MAKGSGREHGSHALRLADNAPAQAPAVARGEAGLQAARLDRGHQLDGRQDSGSCGNAFHSYSPPRRTIWQKRA